VRRRLRRAGGFAAVATVALAAPALGPAAALPFAVVAVLAARVIRDGPAFELFARPPDRREGQLNGLAGFALAATGLALLATVPRVSMPTGVFVAAVVVVAFGNLGEQLVREASGEEFVLIAGFAGAGFLAAVLGQVAVAVQAGSPVRLPAFAFLAAVAALVAGLIRAMLFQHDDALVMLSVGLVAWLFAELVASVTAVGIGVALGVTVGLGYVSYALGTASVPGMLTGVLLGLLTIVLGGFGWFAALIAFYAIGGLAAKYRFDEKAARGVAQERDGARGTGNVLANSAVALAAVVGVAAGDRLPVPEAVFAYAFVGAVATAMGDTLSSEIGGLFDDPRLITTLEPVDPGTDGAVSLPGTLAGLAGTVIVAGIAAVTMPLGGPGAVSTAVVGVVVLAGFAGMTADSLLGALLEGDRVGNQTVNLLATAVGAGVAVAAGLAVAVPA